MKEPKQNTTRCDKTVEASLNSATCFFLDFFMQKMYLLRQSIK